MSTTPQPTAPISLADEAAVKDLLANTVLSLWDIVNNLTRLKPSKHDRFRVTIFGSARAQPGSYVYEEVKRVAAALAEMGCDIRPSPSSAHTMPAGATISRRLAPRDALASLRQRITRLSQPAPHRPFSGS
jgi:hypothetical protein